MIWIDQKMELYILPMLGGDCTTPLLATQLKVLGSYGALGGHVLHN